MIAIARLAAVCAIGLAGASVAAQYTVTNSLDSGPGSLRSAILAVTTAGGTNFVIDVRVLGPINLVTLLPPLPAGKAVAIRQSVVNGRLVIDATAPTAAPGGGGLVLLGAGSSLEVPCRIRVNQGFGLHVGASNVRIVDLEVQGGSTNGLVAASGVANLVIAKLSVSNAGQGVLLDNCTNAQLAVGTGVLLDVRNCTAQGIVVNGGADNRIGQFASVANRVGVLVSGSNRLQLGSAAGPRSTIQGNTLIGLQLVDTHGAGTPQPVLQNCDVLGNGDVGLWFSGGSDLWVRNATIDGNRAGGVFATTSAIRTTLGPAVTVRNSGTPVGSAPGLLLADTTFFTATGCVFGPDNRIGVSVTQGFSPRPPTDILITGCIMTRNATGIEIARAARVTLASSLVDANLGTGLDTHDASQVTVRDTTLSNNAGFGIDARSVPDLVIGPGNRLDDNYSTGLMCGQCNSLQFFSNPSISRNRGAGMEITSCAAARVWDSVLAGNQGVGLFLWGNSDNSVIGPDVVFRDMLGTGCFIETSNGVLVHRSTAWNCSSGGLLFDRNGYCQVLSCLIGNVPGIGIEVTGCQLVDLRLSTVVGNLRGAHASGTYQGAPSLLHLDSCIFANNILEDFSTTGSGGQVNAVYCLHRIPAPAGTNLAGDPRFLDPGAGDFRLAATSPALDAGNPASSLPGSTLDRIGRPRLFGARYDCGAFEGPSPMPTPLLLIRPTVMPTGGGTVTARLQYPAADAGLLSLLLLEVGEASGSFQLPGATLPLAFSPALLWLVSDQLSTNALCVVPPGGAFDATIRWSNRLPLSIRNQAFSVCGVTLDGSPLIHTVSNLAYFAVQ